MDAQAADALEFGLVLQRLEGRTATPYGAERARSLRPAVDPDQVQRRQTLTREGALLIDAGASPPLAAVRDVRAATARAGAGGTLAADELAAVAAGIEMAVGVRRSLMQQEGTPTLRAIAEGIDEDLGSVAGEIRRCIEQDGTGVRDAASPRLRQLRRELRASRERVEEALRRMVRSPSVRAHLQETFVAQRGGRPVLAVKASSRQAVPGIVHDASGSGQTLFVEPFEIVELDNRHSETAAQEREEVDRILGELSRLVGARAGALGRQADGIGAIDLALAAAALSRGWMGTPPSVGPNVRLVEARHPLLDPATAVPIDFDLGLVRALVISGPNTGGKTVALKTIGLAVLIHQAGLWPPAREAELPIFDAVLVEIGDQQSIEMSLSTFAAHVQNLIAILDSAGEASLVLVDELASGTDPVEGAALAQALLDRLSRRARLTVVTTHYPELKAWASFAEHAVNGATAIDAETNEPLYRIILGRAGTSHALQTAERLGLDAAVVAAARDAIEPAQRRTASLLAEAEAAERAASVELEAARAERREAQAAIEQARARESDLAAEIERVRASAAAERERAVAQAHADLAAAGAELASLRAEIRDARRSRRDVERAAQESQAERALDRHLGAASAHASRAERELRVLDSPPAVVVPLAVGDPVEAPALGVRGTIVALDGDEAEVAGAGGQRVRIPLARLQPQAIAEPEPAPIRVRVSTVPDAPDEIDVRGGSAHDARTAVRKLVDDAAIAGRREARVIHGRGTGVLREAVRDELRRHPLVRDLRAESADGATVAILGD